MQSQQTITFFGIVSNSATSRTSKNGRKYTAFGGAIISVTAPTGSPLSKTASAAATPVGTTSRIVFAAGVRTEGFGLPRQLRFVNGGRQRRS